MPDVRLQPVQTPLLEVAPPVEQPVEFTPPVDQQGAPVPTTDVSSKPERPSGRQKLIALLALSTTLVCSGLQKQTVQSQSVAPKPLRTLAALTPSTYELPSSMGDISVGVVIAHLKKSQPAPFGFTPQNTLQYTQDAERNIADSTQGAVHFAAPQFYGALTVNAEHPEAKCAAWDGEQAEAAAKFNQTFSNNVLAAAIKAGYDPDKNAGLVIYADVNCGTESARSWAYSDTDKRYDAQINLDRVSKEGRALISIDPSTYEEFLTTTHELGHMVLRLGHANLQECHTPGILLLPQDCQWQEYIDPSSYMGYSSRIYFPKERPAPIEADLNGYELLTVGAMSREKIGLIESRGGYTVNLAGIQSGQPGLQMIRVPIRSESGGKSTPQYYWIMVNRAPRMPSNPGLCAADQCSYPRPWNVRVYEALSGMGASGHSTLMPLSDIYGQYAGGAGKDKQGKIIFWDPASGITIFLNQLSEYGNATVTVNYGDPEPVPAAPPLREPQPPTTTEPYNLLRWVRLSK